MSTLFSTPAERHVFLIGFFETACPWPPRIPMPKHYPFPVKAEYHYYMGGRWIGVIPHLCVLMGLALFFKEVLL